jgi:hypothetical protein
MKYLIAFVLLLSPFAAAAQSPAAPKSVADCEKIKNDLAYNQCLASFGPKQGERASGTPSDEDAQTGRSAHGGTSVRGSRGRQAASFNVVSGRGRSSRKASASSGAERPESGRARRRRR